MPRLTRRDIRNMQAEGLWEGYRMMVQSQDAILGQIFPLLARRTLIREQVDPLIRQIRNDVNVAEINWMGLLVLTQSRVYRVFFLSQRRKMRAMRRNLLNFINRRIVTAIELSDDNDDSESQSEESKAQ